MAESVGLEWYRSGTVSVTKGSTNITGAGTTWKRIGIKTGDIFSLGGEKLYEVQTVNSDTSITLKTPFAETSVASANYVIIRNFAATLTAELAGKCSYILDQADLRLAQSKQLEEDLTNYIDGKVASMHDEVTQATNDIADTDYSLNARMNSIVGGSTSDNEVLDARVDYYGETHSQIDYHGKTREAGDTITPLVGDTIRYLHKYTAKGLDSANVDIATLGQILRQFLKDTGATDTDIQANIAQLYGLTNTNAEDIETIAHFYERTQLDIEDLANALRQLIEGDRHEIDKLRISEHEMGTTLRKSLLEIGKRLGTLDERADLSDSNEEEINVELVKIHKALDKMDVDNESMALAIRKEFVDIERYIMVDKLDRYLQAHAINHYIRKIYVHEFDRYLTQMLLRTVIDEDIDHINKTNFDIRMMATAIRQHLKDYAALDEVVNKYTQYIDDTKIDERLEALEYATGTGESMEKLVYGRIDAIEVDLTASVLAIMNILDEGIFEQSKTQLDLQEVCNDLRQHLHYVKEKFQSLDEKDAEHDKYNDQNALDLVSFAHVIKTYISDYIHQFIRENADKEIFSFTVKNLFDDIESRSDKYFDGKAVDSATFANIIKTYIGDFVHQFLRENADKEISFFTVKNLITDLERRMNLREFDNNLTTITLKKLIEDNQASDNGVAIDNQLMALVLKNFNNDAQRQIVKTELDQQLVALLLKDFIKNSERNDIGVMSDTLSVTQALKQLGQNVEHRILESDYDKYLSIITLQQMINERDRVVENINFDNNLVALAMRQFISWVELKLEEAQELTDYDKVDNADITAMAGAIYQHMHTTNTKLNEFEELLKKGIAPTDWSAASSLAIPEPRCAMINFSGISAMPTAKNQNLKGFMEFWDMAGTYFKKKVIMNAQGSSSLGFIKKNISIDICNGNIFDDVWNDDDTFELRIGEWVPQDSFHLKAYYTDFFRGIGVVSYQLNNEIVKSRGFLKDRPWKKELIDMDSVRNISEAFGGIDDLSLQFDTGARCFPDGFPVKVYLNGEFYGLFSFQLKKHRDNMHQTKDNPQHIHLDGTMNADTLFGGNINWNAFEVRNPKNLYCMDGSEYDGDAPKELIDAESEYYNLDSDKKKVKNRKATTATVKQYIINFSNVMAELKNLHDIYATTRSTEAFARVREAFEKYFDVENQIDYLIVSDVIRNTDGYSKNWQWATYNGERWYVNMYDVDMSFGGHFQGTQNTGNSTGHTSTTVNLPGFYTYTYYPDECKARYKELRDSGIISANSIMKKLENWTKRFGIDGYKAEYKRWPNSPCYGHFALNETYWTMVLNGTAPIMADDETYKESTEYAAGDICTAEIKDLGIYTFRCLKACKGIHPVQTYDYSFVVNTDNWELMMENDKPVLSRSISYSADVTYEEGNTCTYGIGVMDKYTFKCIAQCTGIPPIRTFKHRDNVYRVRKWIDKQLENMDKLYRYSVDDLDVRELVNTNHWDILAVSSALRQQNDVNTEKFSNIDAAINN